MHCRIGKIWGANRYSFCSKTENKNAQRDNKCFQEKQSIYINLANYFVTKAVLSGKAPRLA